MFGFIRRWRGRRTWTVVGTAEFTTIWTRDKEPTGSRDFHHFAFEMNGVGERRMRLVRSTDEVWKSWHQHGPAAKAEVEWVVHGRLPDFAKPVGHPPNGKRTLTLVKS